MADILFRCSSLGKLMTEPRSKAEGVLSETAKAHIREVLAQDIFAVDFEIGGKEIEKGNTCEGESINLVNAVRGLALEKNSERRNDGLITGECDLFDAERRVGHDIKTAWSIQTFPIVPEDVASAQRKLYEWQMVGYMKLWDADEWHVDYCLVNTPDELVRFEPITLHFVDHIPAHHRVTTWVLHRDREREAEIGPRVRAARAYYREIAEQFDRTHQPGPIVGRAPVSPALMDYAAQRVSEIVADPFTA